MKKYGRARTIALVAVVASALLSFMWLGNSNKNALTGNSAVATPAAANIPATFADIAQMLEPAVVNIFTTSVSEAGGDPYWRLFQGPGARKQQSLGSGFVVDPDGYILTNNHVVTGADTIKVQFADGKTYFAQMVGSDPKTDIALIKIKSGQKKFQSARLGDSDVLRVGDWVVAMGNPFGLSNTVTAGIVSAKGRFIGNTEYDNLIQTDASINPGNSGGPLVNLKGEVIGVNQSIFTRTGGNIGIGFAIPINLAKKVIPQLKERGKVTRAWLGVQIQNVTPELASSFDMDKSVGAIIAHIVPQSPADRAGLREEDIIIEIDGDEVKDHNELMRRISLSPVGSTVELTILRNGKQKNITVLLTQRPDDTDMMYSGTGTYGSATDKKLGIRVSNVPSEMASKLRISGGVLVTGIDSRGAAANGGIRKGDIILKINRYNIGSLSDFGKVSKKLKSGRIVRVHVQRDGARIFLAFSLP